MNEIDSRFAMRISSIYRDRVVLQEIPSQFQEAHSTLTWEYNDVGSVDDHVGDVYEVTIRRIFEVKP